MLCVTKKKKGGKQLSALLYVVVWFTCVSNFHFLYFLTAISNASILVAGLSIFFVLFFLCASLGVWSARKLSKRDSFDVTPAAPSGEA